MREILFRGKHKADGKWCEGNLHINKQGVAFITPDDTPHGCYGQVAPDTVGQYTGLTDKNGTKIFEGDVVHMRTSGLSGHGEIVYKDGSFGIEDKKRNRFYYMYHDAIYRVEGNIHDNPELMEKRNAEGHQLQMEVYP